MDQARSARGPAGRAASVPDVSSGTSRGPLALDGALDGVAFLSPDFASVSSDSEALGADAPPSGRTPSDPEALSALSLIHL